MPAIMKSVNRPFHPNNFNLPSRISVWFAPIDSDGVRANYFELGDVEDIDINVAETFVEKKSARGGVYSTVKRLISENQGEISLSLSEMVGRNIEIMYRSQTIVDRNDTAGNSAVVNETGRPRLSGTTATTFADPAIEGGIKGVVFYRTLTVSSVTSPDGTVTYTSGTDYTLTNAVEGSEATVTLTVGGFTAAASATLVLTEDDGTTTTLTVGTEIATSGSAAGLATNIARAINAHARSYIASNPTTTTVLVTHRLRDGSTPTAITATGTLDTDLGASGTYTFTPGTASTAATIARIATGAIPNGGEVQINYTFEREACEYSLQDGIVLEGALKIQALSRNGPQFFYEFYQVSIAMNGSTTLNPQEFTKAAMTATILNDGSGRRGRFVIFKKFPDFYVEPQGTCA